MTEAKYTRQDMVTTLSGNIEAWIGVSAAHAYLFFEHFYDALVEAQLISRPTTAVNGNQTGLRGGRGCCGRGLFLISILTGLKVKISQLFTYLFHQLARLFWFKTNRTSGSAVDGS